MRPSAWPIRTRRSSRSASSCSRPGDGPTARASAAERRLSEASWWRRPLCSRLAIRAETGSCQSSVRATSASSSRPLTISTDAMKRRKPRIHRQSRSTASAELLFERVHLPADLIRQAVAELREVLLHLRNLLAEVVRVDAAELEHVVLGDV